jgi:hypothetical protein
VLAQQRADEHGSRAVVRAHREHAQLVDHAISFSACRVANGTLRRQVRLPH